MFIFNKTLSNWIIWLLWHRHLMRQSNQYLYTAKQDFIVWFLFESRTNWLVHTGAYNVAVIGGGTSCISDTGWHLGSTTDIPQAIWIASAHETIRHLNWIREFEHAAARDTRFEVKYLNHLVTEASVKIASHIIGRVLQWFNIVFMLPTFHKLHTIEQAITSNWLSITYTYICLYWCLFGNLARVIS